MLRDFVLVESRRNDLADLPLLTWEREEGRMMGLQLRIRLRMNNLCMSPFQ